VQQTFFFLVSYAYTNQSAWEFEIWFGANLYLYSCCWKLCFCVGGTKMATTRIFVILCDWVRHYPEDMDFYRTQSK